MPDLLIKNVSVIDGSGADAFFADLVVSDGIIDQIHRIDQTDPKTGSGQTPETDQEFKKIINGSGLVASPGFIDMHTHSDFTLLLEPRAQSRVRQGVTTEVTGNCGGSPAPVLASGKQAFMEYMTDLGGLYKAHIPAQDWNWETLDDFYKVLSARGTATNIAPLVGHSTLRANVMGYDNRPPREQEMEQMKHLLRTDLEKGAFGLSSGLIYHPGAFAGTNELVELAGVVKTFNGIYSTHMRSEGKFLFEAVEEALSVARKSNVSLEISHLKCETPVMWGKAGMLLEKIRKAGREGVHVDFDQYPYTAYHTSLLEIFPVWAKERGSSKMIDFLNTPETRAKIAADMTCPPEDWDNPMEGLDWDAVRIKGYKQKKNMRFDGLTVHALSKARGIDPLEAIFQVFCEEEGGLGMIVFSMSEQDLVTILKDPKGMIGSDGCSVSPHGLTGKSPVHPRFYGTFPRVLGRYAREKQVISMAQAVHKMTGLPAKKLGLKDRGLIKKGLAADLVMFDPETVGDMATFDAPHEYPLGIFHVIVNGKAVILDGEHTGKLPGRRLKRSN